MTQGIDVTKLTLMLNELRLPTIKQLWPTFAERSDKEGWPAARFLSAITEHEIAENAVAAAWSGIWRRRNCCREKRSIRSTSTRFR